jgi:hypothetical protein
MTEFTVETPAFRQALATALAFASSDDMLPPIHQVSLKPVEGGVEIAATDRYVLSVEQLNATGEPFEVGIPYDIAKRLLTLLPKARQASIVGGLTSVAQDGERVTIRLVGEYETALTFTPSSEKFVNYRELMDKATAGRKDPAGIVAFGPPVLTGVCRALLARDRHEPMRFRFGGEGQAVFVEHDTLTVLVMPVRIHEPRQAEPVQDVA